jgi:hypothetical protein
VWKEFELPEKTMEGWNLRTKKASLTAGLFGRVSKIEFLRFSIA